MPPRSGDRYRPIGTPTVGTLHDAEPQSIALQSIVPLSQAAPRLREELERQKK